MVNSKQEFVDRRVADRNTGNKNCFILYEFEGVLLLDAQNGRIVTTLTKKILSLFAI